eukprot:3938292-Rhodomonas_salina.4
MQQVKTLRPWSKLELSVRDWKRGVQLNREQRNALLKGNRKDVTKANQLPLFLRSKFQPTAANRRKLV